MLYSDKFFEGEGNVAQEMRGKMVEFKRKIKYFRL